MLLKVHPTTILPPRIASSAVFPFSLLQHRWIVHAHYAPIAPRPPPREYEPDGTLKRYKTNAYFFDHGLHWVRWQYKRAGVFHVTYEGQCSEEFGPRAAYREQFRWWAQFVPIMTIGMFVTLLITSVNSIGICPQVYTVDWMEASRERDRAENSYPFTRYLDRRRKERGPHWLVSDLLYHHHNYPWQADQRDTAYLRGKAIKARNLWLEQEARRNQLMEQDRQLEETLEGKEDETFKEEKGMVDEAENAEQEKEEIGEDEKEEEED